MGHGADELILETVELLQLLVLFREGLCGRTLGGEQLLSLQRQGELGGDGVEEIVETRQRFATSSSEYCRSPSPTKTIGKSMARRTILRRGSWSKSRN